MSSFTKTDCCSTNFNSGSTRNAPIISNEFHVCTADSEETYAIYEDNGSNNKVEQTKKVVPRKLTPVTILVVDTISSVRSRILLKVLLDSGSTTTLTNKDAYPDTVSHVKYPAAGKKYPSRDLGLTPPLK